MTGRRNNAVGPQLRAGQPATGKLIPVLAILFLAAGLMTATQCLAHSFRYHLSLGAHYGKLYAPWAILRWARQGYAH